MIANHLTQEDIAFYKVAFLEAQKGLKKGGLPIGSFLACKGEEELLKSKGVEIQDEDSIQMMQAFIENNPMLWHEDIGEMIQ